MGSGKGNPEHWVAVVKPGRILFELAGVEPRRWPARPWSGPSRSCPFKARFVVRPGHPRHAGGGGLMPTAAEICASSTPRSSSASWPSPGASCSTSASSWPPASWTTSRASATSARTWPGCSPCCATARSPRPRAWPWTSSRATGPPPGADRGRGPGPSRPPPRAPGRGQGRGRGRRRRRGRSTRTIGRRGADDDGCRPVDDEVDDADRRGRRRRRRGGRADGRREPPQPSRRAATAARSARAWWSPTPWSRPWSSP